MKARTLVTIVVFVLIAAALVAVRMYRVDEKNSAPLIEPQATAVVVEAVATGEVQATRHLLGEVLGRTEVALAPRITGHVLTVVPREGDRVHRGDVLARLDAREIEDAVAQAAAKTAAARAAVAAVEVALAAQHDATARDQLLFEAEAIAQEAWDHSQSMAAAADARLAAAKAQLTAAEEGLDSARTRLEYAKLTAPIAGRVSARLADPGDLAVPGRALLRIVPDEAVRIRCRAPAEDLRSLAVGGGVTLTLGDRSFPGEISRIFPAMGREHLSTFEVDVAAPPRGLVSGATVGVDVTLASASGLTVPAHSLLEGEHGAFVFTVRDNKAHLVKVEPVARSEQRVVINGALDEGEQVIVARPSRLMLLTEGAPLRITSR